MVFLCHYWLSKGCSHAAAVIIKTESAVHNGYTTATSNPCQWNEVE